MNTMAPAISQAATKARAVWPEIEFLLRKSKLRLVPISMQDAKAAIGKWHRHNRPPVSGLFAVAAEYDAEIVGVVIAGRPVARAYDDGFTVELTRLATNGHANACSFLYGAARRAAVALGYRRVFTYTLKSESGSSLRAAGFRVDAELEPRDSWSCSTRPRVQTDLFGKEQRPAEAKIRWIWEAGDILGSTACARRRGARPALSGIGGGR